ncbi:hypothetical protein ABG794_24015 [Enterobacter soli]|uniref:hypothetical protein n=1 Tax=Enterobacter soli TaxID=885040 RepID=UPI00325AFBD5
MQRPYEIRAAFVEAIQLNQAIAMSALTASLPDCGDKTTDDSENRYWILSNMGRVVLCDFVKAKFKFPGWGKAEMPALCQDWTLVTSRCINQRGAGHQAKMPRGSLFKHFNAMK